MSIESDNIRAEVSRIAEAAGVTYTATYLGQRKREEWDCDAWVCSLTKGKNKEEFEFFTGLGLRAEPTTSAKTQAQLEFPGLQPTDVSRRTQYGKRYLAKVESLRKPQTPHIADLLHSLILDSGASTQSFASWCDELGYDSDSRKALAIYEACQCNADNLRRIFGVTGIVALQTALEGY